MAKKCYHRQFRKHGRSFYVQNTMKQDMKSPEERYYLSMMPKDGHLYKIVHDVYGDIPKFPTIKAAQDYAFSWGDGEFLDQVVW